MHDSILQRLSAGDMAAMQACIDTYSGLVWSLAQRLCGSATEAEDAVQEVFLAVWESAGRFDPEKGSEVTFVATIARRKLIDRRRSLDRRKKHTEDYQRQEREAASLPTDATLMADDVRRAGEAFEQLSDAQQRVLRLAVHGGYTHEQIAEITDLPLGTVKTHARRGLLKVRELLQAQDAPTVESRP